MDRHSLETTVTVLIGLAIATLVASQKLPGGPLGSAVVLGLAALKGRWILLDFLGLRAASPVWRGLLTVWVLGVTAFVWVSCAVSLLI